MTVCLVVDDDDDHKEIGKILCRGLGIEVHGASNGAEALDFCSKKMPDLILLDWMMPVMDGLEFLKKLRAMPGADKVYVLMCSAMGEEEAIKEALANGANNFLAKPFNPPELMRKVLDTNVLEEV